MDLDEKWEIAVGRGGDLGGYFEISNLGRVRSGGFPKPNGGVSKVKVLSPDINNNGYYEIRYRQKHYRIHQLVADAFIPNPENKPFIDHIDGNKLNNRADNLRWVTHKENINNPNTHWKFSAWQKGIHRNMDRIHELNKRRIGMYTLEGELLKIYPSIKEAAIENNILTSGIIRCAQGKFTHAGGKKWRYIYNE